MNENKLFCRWLLLVTLVIFGAAGGIRAALTLFVPEPLPRLSGQTADGIRFGWERRRQTTQSTMLQELDETVAGIHTRAFFASGGIFTIESPRRCGRVQLDINPITGELTIS